jgi:hypothetical protein
MRTHQKSKDCRNQGVIHVPAWDDVWREVLGPQLEPVAVLRAQGWRAMADLAQASGLTERAMQSRATACVRDGCWERRTARGPNGRRVYVYRPAQKGARP